MLRKSQRSRKSRRKHKSQLPNPVKGALYPYTTRLPEKERHKILNQLVKKRGRGTLIRDLNLRAIKNKNKSPLSAEIMRNDIAYLQNY